MNSVFSPSVIHLACKAGSRRSMDPLFLVMNSHPLSVTALASTHEALAANEVVVMIAQRDEYSPTPAVFHTILEYNRGRKMGLADGSGGYVYSAAVSAARPPADYTARVIPHYEGVAITLEHARTLSQRRSDRRKKRR